VTRKILTYQAPAQLYRSDSLFQREYADCLHIAATSSLKAGLGDSLKLTRWFFAPIITFGELFNNISGGNWSSSKAQLKQFLYLSDIYSTLWNADEGSNRLKLQAMERNQMQVLKTLRMLTELGIKPYDLPVNHIVEGTTEDLFIQIWKRMFNRLKIDSTKLRRFSEKEVPVSEGVRNALLSWAQSFSGINDATITTSRMMSNIPVDNIEASIESSLNKKKLVLHGFYFITPIQELLFKILEDDYELIFLNTYDERFPNTFETVKHFLSINENNTFRALEEDIAIHPLAVKLIESLEGQESIQVNANVDKYVDLPHFIEGEKDRFENDRDIDLDTRFQLITPRAKEVEEQLIANEFLQIPKGKGKLTDYPVGRFLYRLHQIKEQINNLEDGTVSYVENITSEILLDCFSSGCLFSNGEDMRNYVKSLERIVPFCEGASTFDDWCDKLNYLLEEKECWEKEVKKKNSKSLTNRIHKFHSFPMRLLSYFSVDAEDVEVVKKGILALKAIHYKLFNNFDSKKVDVATHLKEIESLVLKEVEDYFVGEEKAIVRKIISDINSVKDSELEFTLKDISKGLIFYLNGSLEEMDEENIKNDKMYSLDSADAAPFRINRKFHLAFVDQKALPINQGFNVWPLSRDLLGYLEKKFPELLLLNDRKKRGSSITRYLLYVLFHSSEDIRISFTENIGKESRLDLALYLKLIGCKPVPVKRKDYQIEKEFIKEPDNIDVNTLNWTTPMLREAQVCPKRAAFSFIFNEQTIFTSDFHHGFLYTKYVTVMNRMEIKNKYTPEEFRPMIDRWFHHWNQMKKDFLFDHITTSSFSTPRIGSKRTKYEGSSYSAGLTYLSLMPTGYAGKGSKNVISLDEVRFHEADPGKHCRYCPYVSICRDAVYSVDFEEE
jgi:hypothetical protein